MGQDGGARAAAWATTTRWPSTAVQAPAGKGERAVRAGAVGTVATAVVACCRCFFATSRSIMLALATAAVSSCFEAAAALRMLINSCNGLPVR